MNGDHFEKWLESVLLRKNSVIVMNNASYHSVKMEKILTTSWTKKSIQEWLSQKYISWDKDMIKIELLQKVSEVKHFYVIYRIETIVEKYGHTILRLPPYHRELNPIEMICSQIKGHVARENKTFKLNDVKKIITQGIQRVTIDNWKKCINHVTTKEKECGKLVDL
ncbi:Protein FAM243A like protein [Argiope bruennichi]|uniref:Protein FAM243A like protein n=1 Tax=Argiope bruennichi TaxID=94029 RepID=A0A8T0F9X7_ARGBR|nr:Protein FAM243A like protein [Argiope bruennichi]